MILGKTSHSSGVLERFIGLQLDAVHPERRHTRRFFSKLFCISIGNQAFKNLKDEWGGTECKLLEIKCDVLIIGGLM